ncbi:MAG TPA: SgcJ/EcaC family oxidoreductase [Myxococcaceae bacterium]|nr:SgcJ/EcaC family oxidoreductase [Myxococcaceae bacterium]
MKPNLRVLVLVPLFVAVLGASAQAQPAKSTQRARDEAALRELVAAQAEAWNRHDAAAWSRDFTDDADFVNIAGMQFSGKADVEKRHDAIFKTHFRDSKTAVTVRRIVFLGPNLAIVDANHEVTGFTPLPAVPSTEPGVLRTRMKYVVEKQKGAWRIIAGQNTAVAPQPKAADPAAPATPPVPTK